MPDERQPDAPVEQASAEPPPAPSKRRRAWIAGALALAGVTALVAALTVPGYGPREGVSAPGVVAGELSVGDRTEEDVRHALEALGRDLSAREISLVLDGKELKVTPAEVGFTLDVDATLAAVMATGRERGLRGLLRSINRTRDDVPLVVAIDAAAFEEQVPSWEASLFDDHPFDGSVEIEASAVVAREPKRGRLIDRAPLREAMRAMLAAGKVGSLAVPTIEVVPPIAKEEVDRAAEQARAILKGPITLVYEPSEEEVELVRKENEEALKRSATEARANRDSAPAPKKKKRLRRKGRRLVEERESPKRVETRPLPEPVEVVFDKAALLAAFRARRVDDPKPHFVVELDEAEVKRKLAPTVAKLFNASRDARFEIDDAGKVTIVDSRPGTRVDTKRLVEALYTAAKTADRKGQLPVDKNAEPKFTTQAARALKIKGLVSEFSTHHACCQPRVKNIHRICDMLDGAIIKQGDTFSVNAAVGPRTLERGFVVAPSIGDGEMTETPGGGVSQFATTLYNALFDGGYVIRERKPHSFYFSRYPMGIEATLSYPSPDLVFYNDTDAAILLRCDYDDTHVRVRLFGDNGGRHVERRVSQPFDYTEPRVEYVGNPRRDPDSEKVKDGGSLGFSVVTTRILTMPDGSKREEKRTVKYTGKPRLIEVHPCKIPKGEKGYTGKKCPDPEPKGEGGASG